MVTTTEVVVAVRAQRADNDETYQKERKGADCCLLRGACRSRRRKTQAGNCTTRVRQECEVQRRGNGVEVLASEATSLLVDAREHPHLLCL
jgi:hypothetical protein